MSNKTRSNYALSQQVTQDDWDRWFPYEPTKLQLKLAKDFMEAHIVQDESDGG